MEFLHSYPELVDVSGPVLLDTGAIFLIKQSPECLPTKAPLCVQPSHCQSIHVQPTKYFDPCMKSCHPLHLNPCKSICSPQASGIYPSKCVPIYGGPQCISPCYPTCRRPCLPQCLPPCRPICGYPCQPQCGPCGSICVRPQCVSPCYPTCRNPCLSPCRPLCTNPCAPCLSPCLSPCRPLCANPCAPQCVYSRPRICLQPLYQYPQVPCGYPPCGYPCCPQPCPCDYLDLFFENY